MIKGLKLKRIWKKQNTDKFEIIAHQLISFLIFQQLKISIMKNLFVSYLFIAFFLTVNSLTADCQITKGNWLVGGTGKFYSYTSQYTSATYSNEAKYTQIDLSPNIGYFVMDKLAFGVRPSLSSIKGEVTTSGGGSTNTQRYWIGPVLYFNSSVGIEFLLGYSSSVEDVEGYQKETRKGFQIGIGFQIHLEK